MKLYLVRHGETTSELDDPARPLSAKGKTEIQSVASFLDKIKLPCSQIYSSDKTRAQQTSEILSHALTPQENPIVMPALNPDSRVENILSELGDSDEDIMLVSHLPVLPELLNQLLFNSHDHHFLCWSPGTIVALTQQEHNWCLNWILNPSLIQNITSNG